jgi:hypothetical protein
MIGLLVTFSDSLTIAAEEETESEEEESEEEAPRVLPKPTYRTPAVAGGISAAKEVRLLDPYKCPTIRLTAKFGSHRSPANTKAHQKKSQKKKHLQHPFTSQSSYQNGIAIP